MFAGPYGGQHGAVRREADGGERRVVRRHLVPRPGVVHASIIECGMQQWLTVVHFSAQPEPFLTLNTSSKRLSTPSTPALNTL
jgi:hypothetical protein